MASVFTQIMAGDIPGVFVYEDEKCVAIMTIQPIKDGHLLVIPREEIDHWQDLPDELASHLILVAKKLAVAVKKALSPTRVGLVIAGLEVPHTHLHVIPVNEMNDFDFSELEFSNSEQLKLFAEKIKACL